MTEKPSSIPPVLTPLSSASLKVRVVGGVTVAVPNKIELLTPYVLLEQENWFEDEIGFLCKRLETGMRVVDIGANYGLYALSLANVVGPSGRVWAVEPSSGTSVFLRESVSINGLEHVTVIQKALSNHAGTARLTIEGNSELNSISSANSAGATEEVELTTLDALAATHAWGSVDFLKLDAEGEEERIIEGGTAFLSSADPLIMFEIKHGERLNMQLVDRLAAAGYASYQLIPGLDMLVPFDAAARQDVFRLNLFACKPEKAARLARSGALSPNTAIKLPRADTFSHYRAAHDESLDPSHRYASLQAAYAQMKGLCEDATDADRLIADRLSTCARLARELGEREQAIGFLARALERCDRADPGAPSEPFLPASAAFDAISADGRHKEWLRASLLDGLITLGAFSSYFAQGTAPKRDALLERLEKLRATGFQRAPMERRRQLVRVFAGLQAGPVSDPLLTTHAPDNLNPELWGG